MAISCSRSSCFGNSNGSCTILSQSFEGKPLKKHNTETCRFYKTQAQNEIESADATKRLFALGFDIDKDENKRLKKPEWIERDRKLREELRNGI